MMRSVKTLATAAAAGAIALTLAAAAVAQMGPMRSGAGGPHMDTEAMTELMTQHMQEHMARSHMMGPAGSGMTGRMVPGMMGRDMMGRGMMGDGPGSMGPAMHRRAGMGRMFGMRVLPRMHLTADDVRHHLDQMLESLGNDRLKVGNVKEKDKDTVTAEIVTVDNSLVQSLEVDRHTGMIDYGK